MVEVQENPPAFVPLKKIFVPSRALNLRRMRLVLEKMMIILGGQSSSSLARRVLCSLMLCLHPKEHAVPYKEGAGVIKRRDCHVD